MSLIKQDEFRAFLFTAVVFLLCVYIGFLPLIFSALVAYGCVNSISSKLIASGSHSQRSNFIAVSTVAVVVVGLLVALGFVLSLFLREGSGIEGVGREIANALESLSTLAPAWLSEAIPEKDEFLRSTGSWLKQNAAAIGGAGIATLKTVGYSLLGLIIGALIAVRSVVGEHATGPVTRLLFGQIANLTQAFWNVVNAQVKISALNTTLTALYILLILPLAGIHLSFAKTLVIITFVAGLIPVAGNLISNTAIVAMSLTAGVSTAFASLAFLVIIHKLEYFINARFVGERINARAFEILIVLIVGEKLFGVAGVVAGPVFYAWLKGEWRKADHL